MNLFIDIDVRLSLLSFHPISSAMVPPPSKKKAISAASARSHVRPTSKSSSGFLTKFLATLLASLVAWSYQAIQPPPPRVCGSPNGPPVTSSRIKLKDGRHIAYLESGVPKEKSNYNIIYVHAFDSCRFDVLPISKELLEELGIYLLSFDRSGYGESDPNPKRTEKSIALDIEELAEQLELKSKFYVIGHSMGGEIVWTCLKYIPHRLAGVAISAPVANYWWPGFPANVSEEAYNKQLVQDQMAVRVAHYVPRLTYWWNTQKWFPSSSVIAGRFDTLSIYDKTIITKLPPGANNHYKAQVRQQGEFESIHRDMIVAFGNWEFDPMDLDNPFPNGEGSVHLWHGADDSIVPVELSRSIAEKLPWIHYHELPDAGHIFPLAEGMSDTIVKALLLRDS